MTRTNSHIESAQIEDNTAEPVITNIVPKTVMGSGIAPPRLCNVRRPNFRNQLTPKTKSSDSQH